MKKDIKVFYAVQVSNFTNTSSGPKWLLRNDACTNLAVGIISALLDKYDNLSFLIKLPEANTTIDVENLYEFFDRKYWDKVKFLRDETIPISPVTSRFNFDMSFFKSHKHLFETVDVMINDENTLTKNWNVFFNSIGVNIPIISTNYFLDSPIANKVPEKIRYYERQMESFINSDIAAFQCEAGRIEAMEAYDVLYKSRNPLAKQSVWGVGCHATEIKKHHTSDRFDIPTIYFGNRISDTANKYTNYDSFAEAIGILSKKRGVKDFRAVMLNPTRKATPEQLKLIDELSNGKVEVLPNDKAFTREEYLTFINKAHISANLFVTEVHGGVTHCEALLSNNQVVMPKVNNYWHKFKNAGHEDYPLFIKVDSKQKHKPHTGDLANKLKLALDNLGTAEESRITQLCYNVGYDFESYESAAERIYNDIKSLV